MPNHVHGIIIINNFAIVPAIVRTEHCSVRTVDSVPTIVGTIKKYGLLSKIVKSFKETCVKYIHKNFNDYDFAWQRSFHDHIIRNNEELNRIRAYILYNPINWKLENK